MFSSALVTSLLVKIGGVWAVGYCAGKVEAWVRRIGGAA